MAVVGRKIQSFNCRNLNGAYSFDLVIKHLDTQREDIRCFNNISEEDLAMITNTCLEALGVAQHLVEVKPRTKWELAENG